MVQLKKKQKKMKKTPKILRKPTKTQFYVVEFIILAILLILFGFTWEWKFPGDSYDSSGDLSFGPVHVIFNFIIIISWAVITIWSIVAATGGDDSDFWERFYVDDDEYMSSDDDTTYRPFRFKRPLFWILTIVFLFFGFKIGKIAVNQSIAVYNKSKMCHNDYNKKVQEKKGFYDKLWKTYLAKEKITNVNKETFMAVTKLIMENRKDGDKLAWKWLQENQQIPYQEFTKFYEDLSVFITSQREGYFNIELICQDIANRNNTLLDTFPNNFYNKILKCKHIKFEYGFTSDSTETVFKNKKENITQ